MAMGLDDSERSCIREMINDAGAVHAEQVSAIAETLRAIWKRLDTLQCPAHSERLAGIEAKVTVLLWVTSVVIGGTMAGLIMMGLKVFGGQ